MASGKKNIKQKNVPLRKNPSQAKFTPQKQSRSPFSITSSRYFIPSILFLLCFLLYGNTLHDGYALDDNIYTYQNEYIVKGFSALKDIFNKGSLYGFDKENASQYRPLVLLNFMAESSFFGFKPHVNHFFNVLFFAFTVVLLYFFLWKILKNYNLAIITAATLLFAFHPIHTEVVANIKSRDEILGFLFGLLSFYTIMLYQEHNKKIYYILSLTAFFASLFCKENCLTFVAIIPLLLYFFTPLKIKKIALLTIPYIGLVCIYLFIRSRVLPTLTFATQIPIMDNALMAANNNADRLATSFVLLGKYLYMMIVPYPLSFDYSYNQIPVESWGNVKPVLSLLVCIFMVGYMLFGVRRKSVFSFLIMFFFITLFLSSNLVIRIASTFAERFLYVPSLSFCIALPVLAAKAFKSELINKDKNPKFFFLLSSFFFLMAVYTIIVIPRNAEWENNFTLCSSGVIASPNSGRTHQGLAIIYIDSAQHSKDPSARYKYNSLAAKEFKRVTQIFTMDPESYYSLGIYYYNNGLQDSAIPEYKKTLELNPEHTRAAFNLGAIYFNKGQYDTALAYFFMSYNADTNNLYALNSIGEAYQNEQKIALALHYDSLVLKKVPGYKSTLDNLAILHNAIGMQYLGNNLLDKALEEFRTALTCDSTLANAMDNLGMVYEKKGDIPKAKVYFQKALAKDPKNQQITKKLQLLNIK